MEDEKYDLTPEEEKEMIKESIKHYEFPLKSEIERKLLNLKYEYANGIIIRLNKIKEDVDYFIRLHTNMRDMDSELFLENIRKYKDYDNLELLEDLIKLKHINFKILERLNQQIVDASK